MQYLKGLQGSLLQALLRPEIDECCAESQLELQTLQYFELGCLENTDSENKNKSFMFDLLCIFLSFFLLYLGFLSL